VIERAILLHQNDNVFGVKKRRAGGRFNGECPLDALGADPGNAGSAREHCRKL
jgi:hypothetical protein